MGAVVVPLLPDFHPAEIENILTHSEAKAIFVSDGLVSKISALTQCQLPVRIRIEDFSSINTD
jgi:long-chain acyl-CoA synthetase